MKLDHVAFRVSDLDRAISFFTEVLGLRLMLRQEDKEHHEAFAFLEVEGGNLELLQSLDERNNPVRYDPPRVEPPFTPHVALRSDNLDRLAATLKARDVPIVEGPLEIPGQVKWLYISDHDHNIVEFVQWL